MKVVLPIRIDELSTWDQVVPTRRQPTPPPLHLARYPEKT
jgi:hypothetical protein